MMLTGEENERGENGRERKGAKKKKKATSEKE